MKHFRPYHFPPLAQFGAALEDGAPALPDQDWQGALADGYRQGQRDGYDAGFEQGLDEGRRAGHAEGMAAGLAQGTEQAREQASAQFEQAAKPVEAMLRSLKKLRADLKAAQRKEVVDLVGKIARQVIRAELALQPVQLLALVDEALAAMPPTRDAVEVFLNPEELKRVTELDPKRAKKWSLMADPSLEPGECRVRAGDHEVDAGCQGRLAACMEQVAEKLQAAANGEEAAA
ncbi:flagellar assembly protein H [Massilia solisilvae]|uniref:Flagellar assembly protein FliH n=1 Tax=Massilia solisilvae TaxID=1811225 RepID=A0ABT2BII7_9BURK|nr:flagellar assembly protein FliH [Massilia solisilvae]MCS0608336.1 flagellar assembly protein H [Massilia solisilvae]